MSKLVPTIGLEVHAQLHTETKMFCNSANDPDETRANVNVCPVCMGHPGTLPTINKEAVRQVLRVGLAVEGNLADYSEFDRKNYFYPDIPKGYQISQYEHPLVSGGELAGVTITRIHLEEDTGKNLHRDGMSLVDFNRAGIPLMELVTEPVITSAEEARKFGQELQLLFQTLEASQANLEKGEMRVEANISVAAKDADEFGTKVEIKNLNSFQVVHDAIKYEIERQKKALADGEELVQETRGWDEDTQSTFSQRAKETSDDYRYFPEPDLPKLKLSEIEEFSKELLTESLPSLPAQERERLVNLGLSDEDTETLLRRADLKRLFDTTVEAFSADDEATRLAGNYITSDLRGFEKEAGQKQQIEPQKFSRLIEMIMADQLSSRGAKDTLEIMFTEGGDPEVIADSEGLMQESDSEELQKVVDEIVAENPDIVSQYKNGDKSVLQFMIGQGMKKTGGSANPELLGELLTQACSK